MRKFVISDIHGNGNLYYTVMSYIENISKKDDVTLYINGDLIDRGIDSSVILIDLINRINNKYNPFKIVYLAGNHELMMYQVFEKRKKEITVRDDNDWYINGGRITDNGLWELLQDKNKIFKIADFIGTLNLYQKLNEKIDKKNIVIVHACAPTNPKNKCDLKIYKDGDKFEYLLWTRKDDPFIPFRCRIGNYKDFSIVGHTPNNEKYGFFYDFNESYINIDGGSAYYVSGYKDYNHYPLVEIKDGYLRILTFNNSNEIIYGNVFVNNYIKSMDNDELEYERSLLNKKLVLRKTL